MRVILSFNASNLHTSSWVHTIGLSIFHLPWLSASFEIHSYISIGKKQKNISWIFAYRCLSPEAIWGDAGTKFIHPVMVVMLFDSFYPCLHAGHFALGITRQTLYFGLQYLQENNDRLLCNPSLLLRYFRTARAWCHISSLINLCDLIILSNNYS